MQNNSLTQVPECISCLALLQSLDVSLNQIEYIDKGIGQCIRLRSLNVSRNRLESLPNELSNCILLEKIVADQNRLTALPETLIDLIAISTIDVRDNQLTSIPLGLCRVPTLKTVLCDGTMIYCRPRTYARRYGSTLPLPRNATKFKEVIAAKSNQRDELQIKAEEIREN
ncbi:leucine-rich repeat domain-containing protein [Skeletonema marinoi]|uniref:Leucine-rich repeat domain-containing protein n=1 Tax=Skeletonema marinoi TaxID=267567 RepID=A0AAD8YMQ7_9STRA|nr:leucine-rich repeat domain-containing protein [Skeletonema marinoi]